MKNEFFIFFVGVYIEIITKFSDFVNSDDCIKWNHIKLIRLQPVFIQKKGLKLNKKQIFSSEKIRYSCMLTRSSERFFNSMPSADILNTCINILNYYALQTLLIIFVFGLVQVRSTRYFKMENNSAVTIALVFSDLRLIRILVFISRLINDLSK